MNYLFLDTSSNMIIISLIKDSKIIFNTNIKNDNNLSSKILIFIEDAFKKCNLKPNDLNKIFIVNGPGSFTGIRCGVTVAKTLAFLLDIEIVSISELEVMASGYNEEVCSVIDARRGYVYAGIYNGVENIRPDNYVFYEELVNSFEGKFISYDYENSYEPKIDILRLIEKHKDDAINVHELVPNYLKKTEAEENLCAKKN